MGSSFLTCLNVGLALYSGILFLKLIIQFGLPNHPVRFTAYLVSLCLTVYFGMRAATDLGWLAPIYYIKWRPLPVLAGSLGVLLQVITAVGEFSHIQQKVISRMPLIGALLVFAFFPSKADWFLGLCMLASAVFLSISVGKARYQKRTFFKMLLFLGLFGVGVLINNYWLYMFGEIFLFFAVFYFFIFQQTFGVSALVEGQLHVHEGALK